MRALYIYNHIYIYNYIYTRDKHQSPHIYTAYPNLTSLSHGAFLTPCPVVLDDFGRWWAHVRRPEAAFGEVLLQIQHLGVPTTGNNGEQRATTTEQRRFVEGGFLKGDLLRRRLKTSILTWLSEIFVILE